MYDFRAHGKKRTFDFNHDFGSLYRWPKYDFVKEGETEGVLKDRLATVFFTVNLWVHNGIASQGDPFSNMNPDAPPPVTNVSLNLLDIGVLL